jgi:nitrile hydratase alpha subunit
MADQQERRRKIARVIANAWLDPAYHARLKKDPHAVLTEAGVDVPKNMRVVEDTAEATHLVIPRRPDGLDDHVRRHNQNPNICSDNPQICSDHPDICSFADGKTHARPDICSA